MFSLNDSDWDWIRPEDAAWIVQTPDVLGGRPRIAGTRVSVTEVLMWVRQKGRTGARQQLQACQPTLTEDSAMRAVHAALSFAAALCDRVSPNTLITKRPDWASDWDAPVPPNSQGGEAVPERSKHDPS